MKLDEIDILLRLDKHSFIFQSMVVTRRAEIFKTRFNLLDVHVLPFYMYIVFL